MDRTWESCFMLIPIIFARTVTRERERERERETEREKKREREREREMYVRERIAEL